MSDSNDVRVRLSDGTMKQVDKVVRGDSGELITFRELADKEDATVKRVYSPHAWSEYKEVLE